MKHVALLLFLVACAPAPQPVAAPTLSTDAFRAAPPSPGPEPTLRAPVPERVELANGLTLLSVPKPALPLISLTVVFKSGSGADPADRPGLAGFVADAMRAGTKTRSATTIADEVETLGASLDISVSEDALTVSVTALEENFAAAFDVVADVLMNPAFAADEVERVRRRRLGELAQALDDPGQTASRVFKRVVFGPHPYGHTVLGEEEALAKISRRDLLNYFAKHVRPANAAVVMVGSIDAERAKGEVTKRLARWQGARGLSLAPAKPLVQPAEVVVIDRAGAPQSQLRVGHLGVSRAHPDYYALVICNAILGGLFSSRINMNLREDKGYTYGARSAFDFLRGDGAFYVSTGVETSVTAPAIREILAEIARMRTSDVTLEELGLAKSRYALSLPGYFQTVSSIASMMSNIYVYDLPLDYYQELPKHIAAVTVTDVRRVAEAHLKPDSLSIVVVGDRQKVTTALAELQRGPVAVRDAAGNVL